MAHAARPSLFLALLVAALLAPALFAPRLAHAQIRRCVTPEGQAIFTDQRCVDVGATEQAAPPQPARTAPATPGTTGQRAYRGCARTLQDLAFEITSAVDANDVNRLAGVYDWVGMSQDASVGVMDRLENVVRRPLIDLVPVQGRPPDDAPPPSTTAPPANTPDPEHAATRHAPVGIRLEQTLANGATPSSTVFGLRRYLGCWWITL